MKQILFKMCLCLPLFALFACEPDTLDAPFVRTATVTEGGYVKLSWDKIPGATFYEVYSQCTLDGDPEYVTGVDGITEAVDYSPCKGQYNYYSLVAGNSKTRSAQGSIYAVYVKSQQSGSDEPGGNDNPGGTDEPDDPNEPGGGSGEDEPEELAAPTGVKAYQSGKRIVVSWNAVRGATKYLVYYKQPGKSGYTFSDYVTGTSVSYESSTGNLAAGTWYFYVTAWDNNANYSKSETVSVEYVSSGGTSPGGGEDEPTVQAPCPVTYTNCTVSGSKMTLRWRTSTSSGCGKPDKAILRVRESITGQYVDLQELSGTATSVTFTYTGWIGTGTYDAGYVYAGIILENEAGTSGGIPKVYDTKNKRWIN